MQVARMHDIYGPARGVVMHRNGRLSIFHKFVVSLFILGAACVARPAGAQQTPEPRIVDLPAADGVILKGTYFSAGKEGPGVLLLHQCNMQRHVWDGLAAQMAASGINVMTFDFRGFGESGGVADYKLSTPQEANEMRSTTWHDDVDVALKYLESQPGVNREMIGAGGASCGVNQAVHLAMRHSEVKSLVLLSEGTDRDGRKFLRNSLDLPVFGAAADDDEDFGVVAWMKWIVSLSPDANSKMVRYETGGHGAVMFAAHKELPQEIVDWFAATLKNKANLVLFRTGVATSSESRFMDLVDLPGNGGLAEQVLTQARKRDPTAVLFSEEIINRLGYERLVLDDTKGAIEILQLNVIAFPNSPNAFDSLSDAYLAAGEKSLARTNAKKALELIPKDTTDSAERRKAIEENAEQKLKQLADGHQE
jgi:dienelactone hydrolase